MGRSLPPDSPNPAASPPPPDFLSGGGEMGARMRAMDWTQTPLGPPATWPQSLRVALRILLTSRQPIWIGWGPELIYFYNDPYQPIVGKRHPVALGEPAKLVWPETWQEIGPMLRTALGGDTGVYVESHLLIMERNGYPEETYYTWSYTPIPNDDGTVGGIFCANTDDTQRVIGERQLTLLRELAAHPTLGRTRQQICDHCISAIAANPQDLPFALLYLPGTEGTGLRLCGASGVEFGHPAAPAFMPAEAHAPYPMHDLARVAELQTVAISQDLFGAPLPMGAWHLPPTQAAVVPIALPGQTTRNGALVVGLNPFRLFDEDYRSFLTLLAGQIAAALGNAAAYEQERQRADALAQLDQAKTVFFSNISHEFRTPLTLMLGPLAEAVNDASTPPAVQHQLELAHRNSLRLLRLVNNLLEFSRIEAGRVEAAYEPIDLAALTENLASGFRSAMERAGLTFRVECRPLHSPVYIDRDMWEKIVLNLISNAFKFTLEGSVTVALHEAADQVVLEVTDTGTGIAQHELPRLFERFHRVENAKGRSQEGSGIGLALVHELVKLHGGTVAVSSEVAQGTRLEVRIPLGVAHLPATRIRQSATAQPSASTAPQAYVQEALRWLPAEEPAANAAPAPTPQLAGARIVLADDNADMRSYVQSLLAPNYRVEAVANGEQARDAIWRSAPDLVISDVMMPRLDGFGLLRTLRATERFKTIPVLLVSARAGEESRVEALEAGADGYLVKPFSARELGAQVGALIALGRVRRHYEQRFQTVLDASPAALTLMSPVRDDTGAIIDFRWTYLNRTAQELMQTSAGMAPGEIVGSLVNEVLPESWQAHGLAQAFGKAIESGQMQSIEFQGRSPGISGTFLALAAPFEGGVLAWYVDISAQKNAETRLRDQDRRKDEFLAMLAHELRNPLAPVGNATELLALSIGNDPRLQATVGIIKRQVAQLTRLVDDLLDVSRITFGKIELDLRTVDLRAVITQAVESIEPYLQQHSHRLSVGYESAQPLYVRGDFARLVQCLSNLLMNAVKYTEPKGRIWIRSGSDGRNVFLEIADTGVGMAPDLLPHVFDLFVQSDRSLDRAKGGLGVGLAVVKRLVEMHAGEVSVASVPGQGSTFEIRLPQISGLEAPAADVLARKAEPRRVLVVDDNEDAADSLSMLLAQQGHEIQVAYTPKDALAGAESFRPDIALLDIGLPGMNGYELAEKLRALPQLKTLRLIALTGYGQAEDQRRALSAGFDRHLVKPVELTALERALQEVGS